MAFCLVDALRKVVEGFQYFTKSHHPLKKHNGQPGRKGIFRGDPSRTIARKHLHQTQATPSCASTGAVCGKSGRSGLRSDLLFRFGSFQNENGDDGGRRNGGGAASDPCSKVPTPDTWCLRESLKLRERGPCWI